MPDDRLAALIALYEKATHEKSFDEMRARIHANPLEETDDYWCSNRCGCPTCHSGQNSD